MKAKRVAIVTGGAEGIGAAITRALTDDGFAVAIGARRLMDQQAADSAREATGAALALPLDVANMQSVQDFTATVARRLGPISALVNNAGVTTHQLVSQHDEAEWLNVIDINLTGPFRMIRACLPGMLARGHGRIVNIASTAAQTATADHAAYCASKSGLLGLTRAVAQEGAPRGVTCVAVSPTWVETDMLRRSAAIQAKAAGHPVEQEIAALAASNPQGRLVQPSEIAAVVAFCCSDRAPGLTGEEIRVDAGAAW